MASDTKAKSKEKSKEKPVKKKIFIKIDINKFDLDGMLEASKELTRLQSPLTLRLTAATESIYSQSFPDLDKYYSAIQNQLWNSADDSAVGAATKLASKYISKGKLPFAMYPDAEYGRLPGPVLRTSALKSRFRALLGRDFADTIYGSMEQYEDSRRIRAITDEVIQRGGTQIARYTRIKETKRLADIFQILASDAATQLGVVLGSDFSGNLGATIQFPVEARLDDPASVRRHPAMGFVWTPTVRSRISDELAETTLEHPLYADFFAVEKTFKNVMEPSPFGYYGIDAGLTFSAPLRFRVNTPVWVVNRAVKAIQSVIEQINGNGGYGAHGSAGFGNIQFDLIGNIDPLPCDDQDLERLRLIGTLFAEMVSQTGPLVDEKDPDETETEE